MNTVAQCADIESGSQSYTRATSVEVAVSPISNPTPPAAAEEPVAVCDTCDEPANPSGGLTMLGPSHANVGFCVTALRHSRATLAARVAELEKENETLRAFRDGVATVNMCGGQGTPEAHREIGQFAGLLKKLNDAQERVAAVEREREALRPLAQFGLSLLNEHREWCDDIDGGYVQQAAEDWGLLAHVRAPVACGAECRCREYGLPADCLRETPVMQAARAALAAAPDHMPDAGKMDAVETVAHVLLTDYQCRRPGHGEPGNFYPLARMILAALRTRTPGGARDGE